MKYPPALALPVACPETQQELSILMELAAALGQFDRTAHNLTLARDLLDAFARHLPNTGGFDLDTEETDNLRRRFDDAVSSLPAIDGHRPVVELPDLDELGQLLIDWEVNNGDPLDMPDTTQPITHARRVLGDYEFRLTKKRKLLAKRRINELSEQVDGLLKRTYKVDSPTERGLRFNDDVVDGWRTLSALVVEIVRLYGEDLTSIGRWRDFSRHIHFAEPHDLSDIVESDWPDVRTRIIDEHSGGDPLPVTASDLGDLAASTSTGIVSTAVDWSSISSADFERLIFNLLRSSPEYENVEWLSKTTAADRGRDISASRRTVDSLRGAITTHIMIQCKRWTTKSVGISDLSACVEQSKTWPKRFQEIIVAACDGFSADAILWKERRDQAGEIPTVELWAGSHLEWLLAERPALRAEFFTLPPV